MGFIGFVIAGLIVILGAGYYLMVMGGSGTTLSVDNVNSRSTLNDTLLSLEAPEEARKIKGRVEEKVVEEAQSGVEKSPVAPSSEEPVATSSTVESQEEDISTDNNRPSEESVRILERPMRSGFSVPEKPRAIDTIVLHSSYNARGSEPYSADGIVKEYEDYGVSAHYLIDRQGGIYRLVADKNIAYHAGLSKMPDGRTNANEFSIGIELMNTQTDKFTAAQYEAVQSLVAVLKKKYPIKFLVGHRDIAPERKTDPWNFDWKKLQ